MCVIETERLTLRELTVDDAEFILRQLNEPSFLEHIGDKGVRTLEDARKYILDVPIESYRRFGHGLYLVEAKDTGTPMGTCGLINREILDDVDIGYTFVPEFWSKGYAFEAASAMLAHARDALGLERVVAIVSPGNAASIGLLEKLGMKFEGMIKLPEEESEIKLFGWSTSPG